MSTIYKKFKDLNLKKQLSLVMAIILIFSAVGIQSIRRAYSTENDIILETENNEEDGSTEIIPNEEETENTEENIEEEIIEEENIEEEIKEEVIEEEIIEEEVTEEIIEEEILIEKIEKPLNGNSTFGVENLKANITVNADTTEIISGKYFYISYGIGIATGSGEEEESANNLTLELYEPINMEIDYVAIAITGATKNVKTNEDGSRTITIKYNAPVEAGITQTINILYRFKPGINPTVFEDMTPNNFTSKINVTGDNIDPEEKFSHIIKPINIPYPEIDKKTVSYQKQGYLDSMIQYTLRVPRPSLNGGLNVQNAVLKEYLPKGAELVSIKTSGHSEGNWEYTEPDANNVIVFTRKSDMPAAGSGGTYESITITLKYPSSEFSVGDKVINKIELHAKEYGTGVEIIKSAEWEIELKATAPSIGNLFIKNSSLIYAGNKIGVDEEFNFSIYQSQSIYDYTGGTEGFRTITYVDDPTRKVTGWEQHVPDEDFYDYFETTKIISSNGFNSAADLFEPMDLEKTKLVFSYKTIKNQTWKTHTTTYNLTRQAVILIDELNLEEGDRLAQTKFEYSYKDGTESFNADFKSPTVYIYGIARKPGAKTILSNRAMVYTTIWDGEKIVENVSGGYDANNDTNMNAVLKNFEIIKGLPYPYSNSSIKSGFFSPGDTNYSTLYGGNNSTYATGSLLKPEDFYLVPTDIELIKFSINSGDPKIDMKILTPDKDDLRIVNYKGKDHYVIHFKSENAYYRTASNVSHYKVEFKIPKDYEKDTVVFYKMLTSQAHTNFKEDYAGASGFINGGENYEDLIDIDQDGDFTDAVFISSDTFNLLRNLELSSKKYVKDSSNEWRSFGKVSSEEDFKYKLEITNKSENASSTTTRGIDVLPYVGDTNILNTNINRGSEFQPITKGTYTASTDVKVYSVDFVPSATDIKAELDDVTKNIILWKDGIIPGARAIKIEKITPLNKDEFMSVEIDMKAPTVLDDVIEIAWNSMAISGRYNNGFNTINMPPAEPNKVGIYLSNKKGNLISGRAWFDENGNGIREEGDNFLANVLVELHNLKGEVIGSVTTDINGNYKFENLPQEKFNLVMYNYEDPNLVSFTKVDQGTLFTDNNHFTPVKGNISGGVSIDLTPALDIINIDGGFREKPAEPSIEGRVWFDENEDGIRDIEDGFIFEVTVELYQDGKLINTTTTDENGNYKFDNLENKIYEVLVKSPILEEYLFTKLNAGEERENSSEFAPENKHSIGKTEVDLTNSDNQNIINVDSGFVAKPSSPYLEGRAWIDENKDGIRDPEDVFLEGVTVYLYDEENNLVGTTTTDENGDYKFDNLEEKKYEVVIEIPDSLKYYFTEPNLGNPRDTNNEFISDEGILGETILGRIEVDLSEDFKANNIDGGFIFYPQITVHHLFEETETYITDININVNLTSDKNYDEELLTNLGLISSEPVIPGEYNLEVLEIENGIIVDDEVYFLVENNKTTEIELENTDVYFYYRKYLGELQITKYNLESEVLEDAVFQIINSDNEVVETLSTDINGIVKNKTLLPIGEYKIKEIKAPKGYARSPEIKTFKIEGTSHEEIIQIDYVNEILIAEIELYKVDKTNETIFLQGAVFQLFDSENNLVEELTTDETGYFMSNSDLAEGDYTIIETKAPDGYLLNSTPFKFTITGEEVRAIEMKATNKRDTQELIITKYSEDDILLEGAEFEIRDLENNLILILVTDENGKTSSDEIFPGDYTIQETKAPEGYVVNPEIVQFTLKKGELELNIKSINVRKNLTIEILKVDENKEPLGNATFEIYNSANDLIEKLTTNNDGKIKSQDLEPGEYLIKETIAPVGYLLDQEPIKVTVDENQTKQIQVTKINKLIPKEPNPGNTGGDGWEGGTIGDGSVGGNNGSIIIEPSNPSEPNEPNIVITDPGLEEENNNNENNNNENNNNESNNNNNNNNENNNNEENFIEKEINKPNINNEFEGGNLSEEKEEKEENTPTKVNPQTKDFISGMIKYVLIFTIFSIIILGFLFYNYKNKKRNLTR